MRDGAILCMEVSPVRINGARGTRECIEKREGLSTNMYMLVLIVCPCTPLHDGNHLGSREGVYQ